jgi:hypothetical protein
MRKKSQTKGIFCLEGMWSPDLRVSASVRPLLELLHLHSGVEYIHREYATKEEFEYYLDRWTLKMYDAFPILYLASHGMKGGIELQGELITVLDLGKRLEGKCKDRAIIFASCSTLSLSKRKLKNLLRKTDALLVCGYSVNVDWMRSTAFELMLLFQMQQNEFSGRGAGAIQDNAETLAHGFPDLEFRIVTVKDLA